MVSTSTRQTFPQSPNRWAETTQSGITTTSLPCTKPDAVASGSRGKATPVGHIGAQDVGAFVELRRMYVPAAERRRGIGTALVRQILAHAAAHGVAAVELWTEDGGVGQALYATLGFSVVAAPSIAPAELALLLNLTPGESEVRMRHEVRDIRRVADAPA